MSTVIKVENLSKQYRLGLVGATTFKEDTQRWWSKVRGKDDPFIKLGAENDRTVFDNSNFVWSLKDINFEVRQGEVLGIIGRNGAGKSTLLKILSKVTAPTTGSVKVKGRIASLLEVGTGFHPELTGRENIYLNGAILGMRKHEITRKLDEIISFAGVEKYVDTPVKRYSSGMYVRLAFAVAAHLESEILILDEVLAVGDADFQKKCLGKIGNISKGEGRTVLFVSHNLAAIKSLCTSGVVLRNGKVDFIGSQLGATNHYVSDNQTPRSFDFSNDIINAPGNDFVKLLKVIVEPGTGNVLTINSGINIIVEFFNYVERRNIDITLELENQDNIIIFHYGKNITTNYDSKNGIYNLKFELPIKYLNCAKYSLSLIFGESQKYILYSSRDILFFDVLNESSGSNSNVLPGVTIPDFKVEMTFNDYYEYGK